MRCVAGHEILTNFDSCNGCSANCHRLSYRYATSSGVANLRRLFS